MQIIPLQPIPNQTVNVSVGGQSCTLHVYQKVYGLFIDVYVNNNLIIGGVICENLNRIVRSAYLGFIGDFVFIDNQGTNDPYYTGLGDRYSLAYVTPADIASNLITPVKSSTFIIPPSSAELTPTTLQAILLSSNTFPATGGAAAGTIVGTISVETVGPEFVGTISVGGTNGADFVVNGSLLSLSGSLGVGTYNISLTATQAGAVNSPLTQDEVIVGTGSAFQLTGITLSQNTFVGASGSGTFVGAITVNTVGGSWGGSLSLTGPDAAKFTVNGSNLVLAQTVSHGSYNISIVATDAGAIGSPFTQAESITGEMTITAITVSNTSFLASGSIGTVVGTITVHATGGTFNGTLTLTGSNSSLFSVSGSGAITLATNTIGAGSYAIDIIATQSGAGVIGSPFTQAISLVATAPTVTWNPSEADSGLNFTNNNLTVTNTLADSQYKTTLATKAVNGNANAKVYWEVSVDSFAEPASAVAFLGIAQTGQIGSNIWLGDLNIAVGYRMGIADGTLVLDNVFTTVAPYAQGDIIEIAVDTSNELIWVRPNNSANWNNNASANPATGAGGFSYSGATGGTYYPAIQFDTTTTYQGTANFGSSPFNGTVPSGFVALALA